MEHDSGIARKGSFATPTLIFTFQPRLCGKWFAKRQGIVAERLFSLIGEDRMSEQAKTSEEAPRASENERSHSVLALNSGS